jgi:endonuclease III
MAETRAATVLQILRQTLAMPAWSKSKNDPFETLIVTIISQNTADRNTARAFEDLSKRFEITPEALAKPARLRHAYAQLGFTRAKPKQSNTSQKH